MTNIDKDALMNGIFGTAPLVESVIDKNSACELALDEIYDKPNHTFKKLVGTAWDAFVETIKKYGVQEPIIVRKKECSLGEYECIAGHNRCSGSIEAGLTTIPAIIIDCDDADANMLMVITNSQRPEWLPSEKAKSWAIEYETVKQQGRRTDLDSSGAESAEEIMEKLTGQNIRTVQRYIKLCDLIDSLIDLVDENKIKVTVAYELSFLYPENQQLIVERVFPNYGLTKDDIAFFKQLQEKSSFDLENIKEWFSSKEEEDKEEIFRLSEKEITGYFPENYSAEDKKNLIYHLLEQYFSENSGVM